MSYAVSFDLYKFSKFFALPALIDLVHSSLPLLLLLQVLLALCSFVLGSEPISNEVEVEAQVQKGTGIVASDEKEASDMSTVCIDRYK